METSSNVFTKLRKDATFIERTMDLVEVTLSKPAQVFHITKSVEAEQIVQEELKKTGSMITDLKVFVLILILSIGLALKTCSSNRI